MEDTKAKRKERKENKKEFTQKGKTNNNNKEREKEKMEDKKKASQPEKKKNKERKRETNKNIDRQVTTARSTSAEVYKCTITAVLMSATVRLTLGALSDGVFRTADSGSYRVI